MKKRTLFPVAIALLAGAGAVWYLRRREDNSPNQSIYRAYAPIYDRMFGPFYASERWRTTRLLALEPGERLLICGVGTGLDLPLLEAGVDVTGVDISPEMLAQAGKKVSPANVHLMQMDAQYLEFPSASFDAVLLNLIVSVAPDGQAVFREAWRVLKPGGRLVLFDKFAPENSALGPARRTLGKLIRLLGTDVNRRLSDVVGIVPDGNLQLNEPSLFFGQYRILKYQKNHQHTAN